MNQINSINQIPSSIKPKNILYDSTLKSKFTHIYQSRTKFIKFNNKSDILNNIEINNHQNIDSNILNTNHNSNKINRTNRSIHRSTSKINKFIQSIKLNSIIQLNKYFLKFFIYLIVAYIHSFLVFSINYYYLLIKQLIRFNNLIKLNNLINKQFYLKIKFTNIWIINFLIIFNCLFTCDAIKNQYNKAVGAVPGDLVLGALFPVHHAPGAAQAQTRTCGDIREQYGIQRVEAAFQTIDLINENKEILPDIQLGIEVRDSCWYSPIALEQSIEFIRDAMSTAAREEQSFKDKQLIKQDESSFLGFYSSPPPKNKTNTCPKQTSVKNLVGVIGPASSSVTIQVQNLLQLFNIPQIGYSATSRDLSAKNYYKYFLRVVPSDLLQAQVMIEFIKRNNWTFISTVYTDGNYGSSLAEVFKGLAQDAEICIANTESVIHNAEDAKFDEIVKNLQSYKTAKVVACFCEGMTVRGILKAFRRLNATGEFILFGSDGWSDRYDVIEGYEEEAVGGLSVRIYSPYVHEFDDYYFKLNPATNTRNPWFKEFWEFKFNCTFLGAGTNNSVTKQCTGREKLTEKYKQDTKMAFVVKAIWTMAYGLHSMQQTYCPSTTKLCSAMIPVNGSTFLQHLLNVSFQWNNEKILFDQNGDPPGRYDIMNFQKQNGSYDYQMIGTWDSRFSFLNLTENVHWPNNMILNNETIPESVCSKPCKLGHAKSFQSDTMKCCWACVPCRENQYLANEFTCESCLPGYRPNSNLTGCLQIPVKYIQWTETPSLVAISISIIGLLSTLFTMTVFIKHNNTPVVKASTKELSYLIMLGMILANCTTFFLIAKPTKFNCLITRILPGFSFAVIYGSLVTKTNRIARILAGSKKRILTKKPRFMSSASQVIISCLLICIEIGILTFTLLKEPADSMLDYPNWNTVVLICNTTSLGISAPMGFDFFLISMCTVYAVKTRNVPENFNEAKFIGFTMYTTIVIWGAFFPIYFGSNSKVISLCLCISLSAIIALVLLFFPKIYIILFKPEKNNRSFFTTARNVRCHIGHITNIGYVPTLGISRHSSHSASDFSVESPRTYSVEQQHYQHKLLHTNILQEKGITGGFVEAAAARALLATSTNQQRPTLSVSSASTPLNSKSPFSFFSRLRNRKKDKIKANVEQKIRAVRAAEALDRQTNIKRTRVPPRQSSLLDSTTAGAGEESQSSMNQQPQIQVDTQKLKLLNLWKHAYLDELAKIPGLLEFIDIFKENYVLVAPSTDPVGKSRRAISMVLPKTIEGKELIKNNNNNNNNKTDKKQAGKDTQIIEETAKNVETLEAGKSNTSVQTSFDLLPQVKNESKSQKNVQHLQNISIVKTPLSRLKPCTRTDEQKRLDYERTIAELKQQAIEVGNRLSKRQLKFNKKLTTDLILDDNNNKQEESETDKQSIDEHQLIDNLPPPPPPVISSKFSILNKTQTSESFKLQKQKEQQRLLMEADAVERQPHLPTAEELILRVNQLSCSPSAQKFITGTTNQLNNLQKHPTSNTTSTVRVQTQFTPILSGTARSGSTTVFSHHFPPPPPLDNEAELQTSEHQKQQFQKIQSWPVEAAALINASRFSSSEKDALHEQFSRITPDKFTKKMDLNDEKQQQFESKESLIIEESASENDEDSSTAIYKKIIISLRNSSNDLTNADYQFSRHQQQSHEQIAHPHQRLHRHTSSSSSSSNQQHSHHHHHHHHRHSTSIQPQLDHHTASHAYQTSYAVYYEQMQQLQQLQHQQQPDDCYFQQQHQSIQNEYSTENLEHMCDELTSAFSSMSRSEPSSARQSRKY